MNTNTTLSNYIEKLTSLTKRKGIMEFPSVTEESGYSDRSLPRIGLLGTYPPEQCGLATFGAALGNDLSKHGYPVDVVQVVDSPTANMNESVHTRLLNGNKDSLRRAAHDLSQCDAVIIQHEYGIYGGPDGDEILEVLAQVSSPTIVVLHTVLTEPSQHQRTVLISIALLADHIVVMTQTAYDRLLAHYPVDASKVSVIPHGAALPASSTSPGGTNPPQLLTWGLIGPGKGIENVIDALAMLPDNPPRPSYTVAGVTHPKVLAQFGDAYRESLIQRAADAGLSDTVIFDDTYRTVEELTQFVASASLVILPYDSKNQITSGVLVDALVAGKPVIATAFPHAIELLSDGAGIVVPHGDIPALSEAIRISTSNPEVLAEMSRKVSAIASSHSWSAVAEEYASLVSALVPARKD